MPKKIVRTVPDESKHQQSRKVSEQTEKRLRQPARKAIQECKQEASGIYAGDPIFNLKSVSYRDPKDYEHHDAILCGGKS